MSFLSRTSRAGPALPPPILARNVHCSWTLYVGEPNLLTFKGDGEPTCAVPADERAATRVRETVSALGLDSDILCEARREKWRNCETKLKKLRDIVERNRQRENPDAAAFSHELCRDIATLFDDRAEFTATAKACAAELEAGLFVDDEYTFAHSAIVTLVGPEGGIVTRFSSDAVVDDLARALRRVIYPAGS